MIGMLIAVALGGALGAVVRFGISVACTNYFGGFWPMATLIVNVTGSFLIGYVSYFFIGRVGAGSPLNALVTIGFLGALTTFSTFSIETIHLYMNHHVLYALGNVLLNVTLCLIAVSLGLSLSKFH